MIKFLSIRKQHLEQELIASKEFDVHTFSFGRRYKNDLDKHNQLINLVKKMQPHIFWIWKHEFITPETLSRIKKVSPKTKIIMWYGDLRGNQIVPLIRVRRPFLDGLLITNNSPDQLNMYKNFGIPFVHPFYHSFSPEEFKLWNYPITHDVFFGGTNFNIKKFPLSALRRKLINGVHKRFKLVVHGNGWKFKTQEWILRQRYAKELRKAHINLGINHYNVRQYYNRRLFESVASGKLHITYYIKDMERHFINKKHLVWFHTLPQAFNLIRYYLNNPEERELIAKQGRDFFIKNHSWENRTKQFINIIKKIL